MFLGCVHPLHCWAFYGAHGVKRHGVGSWQECREQYEYVRKSFETAWVEGFARCEVCGEYETPWEPPLHAIDWLVWLQRAWDYFPQQYRD